MFPPVKLGENPGSLFDRCSARNRAKAVWKALPELGNRSPAAECPRHLFSALSFRFSVVSLEGFGARRSRSVHSDKKALFGLFEHKRLIGAVRMAAARQTAAEPPVILAISREVRASKRGALPTSYACRSRLMLSSAKRRDAGGWCGGRTVARQMTPSAECPRNSFARRSQQYGLGGAS